jgi:hypothetical protein
VIESDVQELLAQVPSFAPRYLGLVEACDGDPGAAVTLTELADHVATLVAEIDDRRPRLAQCLSAVETLASASVDGEELVAWAFLDSLSPDDRHRLENAFGPRTRSLLEDVGSGPS